MKRKRLDDAVKATVVESYRAGERVSDIQAVTGVERGTIYYVLREAGISPNRQASAGRHPAGRQAAGGAVDYDLVIDLLQRRVRELEEELAQRK